MATCDHHFVAPTLVSSDQVEPLSEEVHKFPLKTAATILLPSADIAMEYQLCWSQPLRPPPKSCRHQCSSKYSPNAPPRQ